MTFFYLFSTIFVFPLQTTTLIIFFFSLKTNIFFCKNNKTTAKKQDPILNLLLSLIQSSYKVGTLGGHPLLRSYLAHPPFYIKKK